MVRTSTDTQESIVIEVIESNDDFHTKVQEPNKLAHRHAVWPCEQSLTLVVYNTMRPRMAASM